MKKNLHYLIAIALFTMSFTTLRILSNPNAPLGYTTAPKQGTTSGARNCTSCHGDFGINSGGGAVVATGLPSGSYLAGQVYNFSVTVTHSTADRTKWGFAIKAVNTVNNNVVGTFTTTNTTNASVKGTAAGNTMELSHKAAGSVANSKTYTFNNLTWTAPAVPGTNDGNIKFYLVGVAGNNSGDEAGDYVYSTSIAAALGTTPVTISSFNTIATNQNSTLIQWKTAQEINTAYFEIEKSIDANMWQTIGKVNARGNSTTTVDYSFNDDNTSSILFGATTNYYRIKIVDFNGTERYSSTSVISSNSKANNVINRSAMPIRAGSLSKYEINVDAAQDVAITICDMNGKVLHQSVQKLNSGSNLIQLQAPATKGIYPVKFATKTFVKTLNQIVQ